MQELAMAPKSKQNGDNTARKWMIHRKQNKVHAFVHVLVVSEQDARKPFFSGFTSFKCHFERNFVYISIFKNGPNHIYP